VFAAQKDLHRARNIALPRIVYRWRHFPPCAWRTPLLLTLFSSSYARSCTLPHSCELYNSSTVARTEKIPRCYYEIKAAANFNDYCGKIRGEKLRGSFLISRSAKVVYYKLGYALCRENKGWEGNENLTRLYLNAYARTTEPSCGNASISALAVCSCSRYFYLCEFLYRFYFLCFNFSNIIKYIRFYAWKSDLSKRIIGFMQKLFQAFWIIKFISKDKMRI